MDHIAWKGRCSITPIARVPGETRLQGVIESSGILWFCGKCRGVVEDPLDCLWQMQRSDIMLWAEIVGLISCACYNCEVSHLESKTHPDWTSYTSVSNHLGGWGQIMWCWLHRGPAIDVQNQLARPLWTKSTQSLERNFKI
ncbi:hypothetical protein FH972_010555 [Carpinus fangiana]|uniref:Uncharacterized protein n=1 Tax=Carpinus fangiana TaxID=176857 RepID=A0A660KNM1_9ROSI|nr:hypothetical protein FH972_010555 [Carpinus fangiana]